MPSVKLIAYYPNYLDILKQTYGKPYGSNITTKALQSIIASGHTSGLEHCNAVFDVKCSVRVLGQITRHRCLSFTVQSSRGKKPDTFVEPLNNYIYPLDNMACAFDYYDMVEQGYALEDAAYYLPQGVETNMVVSGNLRAWLEYLPWRLCQRAMPEHRKLAELIHEELRKVMPEIFDKELKRCANCKEKSCKF